MEGVDATNKNSGINATLDRYGGGGGSGSSSPTILAIDSIENLTGTQIEKLKAGDIVKESAQGLGPTGDPLNGTAYTVTNKGDDYCMLVSMNNDTTFFSAEYVKTNGQWTCTYKEYDIRKHFKGWWTDLATLKAAHTAEEGDSAYVKDASPATTWSIYVYDATATTDNNWADSGTDADTTYMQTFASGEEVNEVHIVNDLITGGVDDVLSAEQGKKLYNLWFGDDMSGLQTMQYYSTHNKTIGSTMTGKSSISTETSAYSCMKLYCTAGDKFFIFGKGSQNDYGRLWTFTDANNVILSMNETDGYVANGDLIEAPANAVYLYINFYNYNSNTDKLQREVKSSEIIYLDETFNPSFFRDNSVYENDILEVFSTININPAESEYVQLKYYGNFLYYRLRKNVSGTVWYWVVQSDIRAWADNTIYPLVVTSSEMEGVNIGDTIGYIIFKDIEHFKANPSTQSINNELNVSRLTNISHAPKINTSLLLQQDEPQDLEPTYLDGVEVNLPDEIVVSKGDRLQIFWRNVCTAFNPYAFDVIGVCNVGLSYPRYFEYAPDDSVVNNTTHQLTVLIKDNAGRVVSQKSTTIRVVDKIQTPSATKNVLIIGASATANGNIIYELNRRLNTNTGYEYKWKQSGGGLPNVHLGDVYKDSLDNEFTVTTIGTDFIGVVKTLSVSTDKTLRTVTLVSGDPTSPQSFVLEVVASSYPKAYDKPYGLGTQKFNFVGTTSPASYPDLHQEARGGWSWKDYATSGRSAYRFYVTEQQGIMEGAKYQGNGTLVFTVTNDIQLDSSGTGDFSCTFTGSGTQPSFGRLIKLSGDGPSSITYTSWSLDSQNPFWNNTTNQLDLDNYAANIINVESVDLVIFHLGVNDIFSSRTSADCVGYMHTLIDAIHSAPQFANAKIIVSTLPMPSPYGGMTTNYGASNGNSYFAKAKQFWIYGDAFNDFTEESGYSDFVQLATPLHTFDAEHLYPQKNIQVDNRCSETETVQTNGVHPIDIGGYTVADDIYHSIMKVMQ